MTTLSSGNSTTFSLSPNQSVTVTSSPGATGTIKRTQYIEGTSSKTDVLGPPETNQTYGPYGSDVDVELTSTSGDFTYVVNGNPYVSAVVDDSTGRIKSTQGTGPKNGLRVVLVGHSYLDQETGNYTYNRPIEMLNGTFVWANVLMGRPFEIVKSHAIGGERLIDLADRIEDAINEDADVYVWNIGINDLKATVNPGNSRYTGKPYQNDPRQTDLAYCTEFADRLLAKLANTGKIVIVLPETWPANGAGDQTKQLSVRTIQYNQYLAWRASQDANMHYVPLDLATIDPLTATGEVFSGYYSDFIHPSNLGAFKRGQALAAALRPIFPKYVDRLPSNILDTYTNLKIVGTSLSVISPGVLRVMAPNVSASNSLIRTGDMVALAIPSPGNTQWNGRWLCVGYASTYVDLQCGVTGSYTGTINISTSAQVFDNPLMVTQTGGSFSGGGTLTSGTVPSGVTVNCPAGSSCVFANAVNHTNLSAVADGLGKWMDVTITGGANSVITISFLANRGPAITGSVVYGRLFSGDVVQAMYDVDVVAASGLTGLLFGLNGSITHQTDGTQNLLIYSLYKDGLNTAAHPNLPFRGVVGTGEFLIPSGVLEAFDGICEIKFGAGGGSLQLRVGRVGIRALRNSLRDVAQPLDI